MLAQKVAVEHVIGVAEKGARAAIAALGDVVRQTGDDDTSEAGHALGWPSGGAVSIKCTVTVMRHRNASLHCSTVAAVTPAPAARKLSPHRLLMR